MLVLIGPIKQSEYSVSFLDVDCVWTFWPFTNFVFDGITVIDFSFHLTFVDEEVLSSSCSMNP